MIASIRTRDEGPLSLHRHLPERSSLSRVRCAAQTPRALDRSRPFRNSSLEKGKGAHAKEKPAG
jgi:hypothetical protein